MAITTSKVKMITMTPVMETTLINVINITARTTARGIITTTQVMETTTTSRIRLKANITTRDTMITDPMAIG
jgi:hypothetical protein